MDAEAKPKRSISVSFEAHLEGLTVAELASFRQAVKTFCEAVRNCVGFPVRGRIVEKTEPIDP